MSNEPLLNNAILLHSFVKYRKHEDVGPQCDGHRMPRRVRGWEFHRCAEILHEMEDVGTARLLLGRLLCLLVVGFFHHDLCHGGVSQ